MCVDMMSTVCSQAKVHSVLADFESHSSRDTVTRRMLSMNKAISKFVHQIQSEFQEYVDVAEPFASAILQVRCLHNYKHS